MRSLLLFLCLLLTVLTEAKHIQTETLDDHYYHLQSLCHNCQHECRIQKEGAECETCVKTYTKDICKRFQEPRALYSIHWQKFSRFESVCAVCKEYCWHHADNLNGTDPCGGCKDVTKESCEDWIENGGPDNKPRTKSEYDAENKQNCDECAKKNCTIGNPGYSADDCGYCDNIWPAYTCEPFEFAEKNNMINCWQCDYHCREGVKNHVGKKDYECLDCEMWLTPEFCAPHSEKAKDRIDKAEIPDCDECAESKESHNILPTAPLIAPEYYDRWEINCRTCEEFCRVNVTSHRGLDGTDCSNCEERFTEDSCAKFYRKNYVEDLQTGEFKSEEKKTERKRRPCG